MPNRFTFRNFVKDLGMRIGAAATAVAVFFGLGYIKRTDLLGLSSVLDSQLSFFAAVFLLIGIISALWILYQQSKN